MASRNIRACYEKVQKRCQTISTKIKQGMLGRQQYFWYLEHCSVKEDVVLLESQHGGSLGGNIFALLKELCENPDYAEYKLCLACQPAKLEGRKQFLEKYGLAERTRLVSTSSREYFKVLATAKYLINDNTFMHVFVKRPEQVFFNTWHGTPLKTLGKKIKKDYAGIGNAQHNMYTADYLLYPNEFTMKHMVEDYMLPDWCDTKILLSGYPRNTVFLSEGRRNEIRKACNMEGMQVYAYLPTWRGVVGKVTSKQQNERLYKYLKELDERLTENQRVYVKLHPVSVKEINLSGLKRVLPFPAQEYETYEFLNATDGLITDYSSVFFDYAVSRRKIILFTYDKEEYTSDRGFYFPLDELPFPQVDTVEALADCMSAPKEYDDTEFLATYCAYENENITEALLRRVFFSESSDLIHESKVPDNGKKNVVFYLGAMKENKITTAAAEFLRQADREHYNYMVVFKIQDLKKNQERILVLPEDVTHFGHYENISMGLWDMLWYRLWRRFHVLPYGVVKGIAARRGRLEAERILGECRVDTVVHFTGYTEEMLITLGQMPCRRIVFAHNDMEKEIKKGMSGEILREAYRSYDVVAVFDREIQSGVERIAGKKKPKKIVMLREVSELSGLL